MNNNKVELFTTSLGIIRTTYVRCLMVERILHNHLITYEVKDVSLNKSYLNELKEKLENDVVELPQVFFKGKLLGNANAIEYLNETGKLRELLQTCQKIEWGDRVKKCVSHWNKIIDRHKNDVEVSRSRSFCNYIKMVKRQLEKKRPVYTDAQTNTILTQIKGKKNFKIYLGKCATMRPCSADAATNTILSQLNTKSFIIRKNNFNSFSYNDNEMNSWTRSADKPPSEKNKLGMFSKADSELCTVEHNKVYIENKKLSLADNEMHTNNIEVANAHKKDEKKTYGRQIFSMVSKRSESNNLINIKPDIAIIIYGERRNCQRTILDNYSLLFANNTIIAAKTAEVYLHLRGVTVEAFDLIYEWMINSADVESFNKLRKFNFLPIYNTSDRLQIVILQQQLMKILNQEDIFCEEDAFFLFQQAVKLERRDVTEKMLFRIKRFFLVLVSCNDFLQLTAEELVYILSSDYIVVNSESEVFFAAVYWLMFDWETRQVFCHSVMNCVRFDNMTKEELKEIPQDKKMTKLLRDILEDSKIKRKMIEALNVISKTEQLNEESQGLGSRNWSGEFKIYKSFSDFIKFIKEIRKCPTMVYSRIQKQI